MGLETALIAGTIGLGAMTALTQAQAGRQQAKAITQQGDYNAQVYEQQAAAISAKQKIQNYQMNRQRARTMSTYVAKTAGKGLTMSGSPLAVMADAESQMLFDQAINNYNLNMEKHFAMTSAAATRQQGAFDASATRTQGNMGAFSTLLNGVSQIGLMRMGAKAPSTPSGGYSYSSYNSNYGSTRMFGGSPLTI